MFKEFIQERTFITRAVNDAKDILSKKYSGFKIKFIKFNDYDIPKKTKIQELKVDDYTIKYFESPKQKNAIFFDIDN